MADENEFSPDIMTLLDDEGKEHTFEILDAIETDDGRYLAMIPYFEDPGEALEDEDELMVMKVYSNKDGEYLEAIDNEKEFNTITSIFTERLEDEFDIIEDNAEDDSTPPDDK